MKHGQVTEHTTEMRALRNYFKKAAEDPTSFEMLFKDPIDTLKSIGIPVDEQHKEAVSLQMKAIGGFVSIGTGESSSIQKMGSLEGFNDIADSFEFVVRPWGLVLVVDEPGMKYIEGGGIITAGILGGIAGVLAVPAAVLGAVLVVAAAALAVFEGVMLLTDQGKGVYLTWTWAQFWPFLPLPPIPNPMYGIPVVTPIT